MKFNEVDAFVNYQRNVIRCQLLITDVFTALLGNKVQIKVKVKRSEVTVVALVNAANQLLVSFLVLPWM